MKIHFVCEGNTYRSRLAEAYFNSKIFENEKANSSGIHANGNQNGPITWLASFLLKKEDLIKFMSRDWTQTNKEILERNDFVIFMDTKDFEYSKDNFEYNSVDYQIWNIKDIEIFHLENDAGILDNIHEAISTFEEIKKKVDLLILEKFIK